MLMLAGHIQFVKAVLHNVAQKSQAPLDQDYEPKLVDVESLEIKRNDKELYAGGECKF